VSTYEVSVNTSHVNETTLTKKVKAQPSLPTFAHVTFFFNQQAMLYNSHDGCNGKKKVGHFSFYFSTKYK
jgi:hypothetical protein